MKRILTLVLISILTMALFTGCQTSDGDASSPAASATRNSADSYATWTQSDWDDASAEQKELAVIWLVEEAVASQGADQEVVQTTVDDAEESLTAEQYQEIEDAVDAYYSKAGDKGRLQDSLNDVMGTIAKYVAIG